jgi:cellulose biosynthesis protein BcsQ
VFEAKINKRVGIEESPAFQKPIIQYRPKEKAALEFRAFAKELLQRLHTLEYKLPGFNEK